MTRRIIVAAMILIVLRTSRTIVDSSACLISEYRCNSGSCVSLDRYCNGADDCGDKSDEPPYCTPCNRTYYGEVGKSYELEIRRPREDRLPFLCYLNFTADAGIFGDLIQITFDTFTVGKFVSYVIEGCPDGYMTIEESGMPFIGGQWCGSAWGYTVYYSETASLNLTLYLIRLSEQGIGYNFDFKISYKFLRKTDAHLRYGNDTVPSWRGNLIPSTYCDRILDQCDVRECRIQSPNYPGVYPRNVTCYYRVEDRKPKRAKHSLIAISQHNAHKVHIKDQVIKYERSQRKLRVWEQCNVIQDYLTVYDGMSTEDPVLVRLCGGDVVPEIISSGPNMLLEFHTSPYDNPFHPVPLSYLPGFELNVKVIYLDARSPTYARERKCVFLISSFNQETKWGYVENTRHSLPPNTTCKYHFQGRAYQTVWLAFVKYYAASTDPTAYHSDEDCNARLRIWDGVVVDDVKTDMQKNATMIGEFCKQDVPKLCDHTMLANSSRFTRPCLPSESYVSTGNDLTLEIYLRRGSVLFPLNFQLRYEFVDIPLPPQVGGGQIVGPSLSSSSSWKNYKKIGGTTFNGGDSSTPPAGCDLLFDSSSANTLSGKFHSPKSVFLYGRGGATNLTCRLTFVPKSEEKVRLKFSYVKLANRTCQTEVDQRTGRMKCVYDVNNHRNDNNNNNNDVVATHNSNAVAEIWISEYPWPGVRIPRHCLCSRFDQDPFVVSGLTSSALEVNFTVTNMKVTEDYDDYKFEGEYHFMNLMSSSDSNTCAKYKASRKVRGSSGLITNSAAAIFANGQTVVVGGGGDLSSTAVTGASSKTTAHRTAVGRLQTCGQQPWLIEPEDPAGRSYLYVKVKGFELPATRWKSDTFQCPTVNRILIYTVSDSRNPKVICPSDDSNDNLYLVEVFSDGWNGNQSFDSNGLNLHSRSLLVEFVDLVSAVYSVRWLEVTKRPYYYHHQNHRENQDGVLFTSSISSQIYDCPYKCPELNACIKPELWCDGFQHCPSGYDESDINCLHFAVPVLYLAAGGGILLILTALILFASWCKYRRHRRKERRRQTTSSISCSSAVVASKSSCRPDVVGCSSGIVVCNSGGGGKHGNEKRRKNSAAAAKQRQKNCKKKKQQQQQRKQLPTDVIDDFSNRNGDIYCKRYTVDGSDLYLERKDSLC